jgi:hypothetical protein
MIECVEVMPHWGNAGQAMFTVPRVSNPNVMYADWGAMPCYSPPRSSNYRNQKNHRHMQEASQGYWTADRHQNVAMPFPWQPVQREAGSSGGVQEHPGPIVVELHGLPQSLCRQSFLEAMLDQAGLADEVMGCVLDASARKAKVTLASWSGAMGCVAHFDGRCWDPTGPAITAKVADEHMPQEACKKTAATAGGKDRKSRNSRGKTCSVAPQPSSSHVEPRHSEASATVQQVSSPSSPSAEQSGKGSCPSPPFSPSKMRWADVEDDEEHEDDEEAENASTSAGSLGRGSRGPSEDFLDFACDTDEGF